MIGVRFVVSVRRMSATSKSGALPRTFASRTVPSLIFSVKTAPSTSRPDSSCTVTTWALVRTRPSLEMMTPEPAATGWIAPELSVLLTSTATTDGPTMAIRSCSSRLAAGSFESVDPAGSVVAGAVLTGLPMLASGTITVLEEVLSVSLTVPKATPAETTAPTNPPTTAARRVRFGDRCAFGAGVGRFPYGLPGFTPEGGGNGEPWAIHGLGRSGVMFVILSAGTTVHSCSRSFLEEIMPERTCGHAEPP
ncbi:unannotated protein [freshwater metagenome]|uniref:Unannotated protein n=1 Tax=freshwater metagenome TaxID=449393 RepID=A0A6J7EK59_9ZZZZ